MVKKKGVEQRYFVLYQNSLDYFGSEKDFQDKIDPRGHLSIDEIQTIQVDSEGFTLVIKGGKSIALKSSDSKEWRDALQQLMQPSPAKDSSTGDLQADAEKILHTGLLDVERKGKILRCFFVLKPSSFDRYEDASEYKSGLKEARGSIIIEDIERFETKGNGFTLTIHGEKRPVALVTSNEADSQAWTQVFERLLAKRLGDAFVAMAAGSGSETATPTEGGTTPRDEERPVCEGTLFILKRSKEEPRYFVLYEDRFEYYSTREDFQRGGQEPRGQADLEAISDFEVSEKGVMELMLGDKDKRKLELKCQNVADLSRWTDAWKRTLDFEPATEEEGEEENEEETHKKKNTKH